MHNVLGLGLQVAFRATLSCLGLIEIGSEFSHQLVYVGCAPFHGWGLTRVG